MTKTKHKTLNRVLLAFLAALVIVSAASFSDNFGSLFVTKASATTYTDGTGSDKAAGNGGTDMENGYDCLWTSNGLTAQQGYRFTLLDYDVSTETYKRVGSVDVFQDAHIARTKDSYKYHLKITDTSGNVYRNIDKWTAKTLYLGTGTTVNASLNKIKNIAYESSAYTSPNKTAGSAAVANATTGASYYKWCNEKDISVTLPNTSGIMDWANKADNINPILNLISSGMTLAKMAYGDVIEVEPLYGIRINNTAYTITETEACLLGCTILSRTSKGVVYNSAGKVNWGSNSYGTWTNISRFTNYVYPNALRMTDYNDHKFLHIYNAALDGKWTVTAASTDTNSQKWGESFKTFQELFFWGYGLGIVYNKDVYTLTLQYDCYGSSPTISSSTYSMSSSDYNRIKVKSTGKYYAQTAKLGERNEK